MTSSSANGSPSRKPAHTASKARKARPAPRLSAPSAALGAARTGGKLEPTTQPTALLQPVHRKYVELARPGIPLQFSARVGTDGMSSYFLLGTDDEAEAAQRARGIQRIVDHEGWQRACEQHVREFTFALFWNNNPLLSTYTTLLTETGSARDDSAPKAGGAGVKVALVERDSTVRRALTRWLAGLPGWRLAVAFAQFDDPAFGRLLSGGEIDLVLFNRSLSDTPSEAPRPDSAQSFIQNVPAFSFGIYETSDDIFISHHGLGRGYFLHRTHPAQVLSPVSGAWDDPPLKPADFYPHISAYFKELLARTAAVGGNEECSSLTPREEEILLRLSKGYPDKQIASSLNISSWTVHNHMKNIFRKLGVHTRTQAVIKYLQR